MLKNSVRTMSFLWCLTMLSGCAQYQNSRGVEVSSQVSPGVQWVKGQTTRQQLLSELGPPSQVVALGEETVLYYLFEHSVGEGLILLLYNRFEVDTRYDRAIFFFDKHGLLTDYASHTAAVKDDG